MKKICLISSEHSAWGGIGHSLRALSALLAKRHEVTLIELAGGDDLAYRPSPPPGVKRVFADPGPELSRMTFSCEPHRNSAAMMEAIESAYEGTDGPDYIEVTDYLAYGLVPLQARRAGHPLLRDALIGVRASAAAELVSLHEGTLYQPGVELVGALEQEQLRLADVLVWRGGDTLRLYRDYYSAVDLPKPIRVPAAVDRPVTPPAPQPRGTDQPLKLLFVGRLQRLKGALELVEACLGLDNDNWQLTMIGADTPTAPGGQSVAMTIEAMCGGDPRVSLEQPLPHEELQRRWAEHDLLVLPSMFEVWGNVVVEAMRAGLPVLATPVGGPAEIVEHGVTGWQAGGLGADAICRALNALLANRNEVERVRTSGAVYERFLQLTDPTDVLRAYDELLNAPALPSSRRSARSEQPLVTGVVPYRGSAGCIEATVESLLRQSHRQLEVIVVNDGSFAADDEILDDLASEPRVEVVTQLSRGEASARNLGACLARGEYLAMLDTNTVLEKNFVTLALEMLRSDPALAYVTCWLRVVASDGCDPESGGRAPLGNRVVAMDSNESLYSSNWDGEAIALLPGRIFSEFCYGYEPTAGIQSDWELYRVLREDGRFGAVIPERLARRRVHSDSPLNSYESTLLQGMWRETRARRRRRSIRWTAEMSDA